MKIKRIHIYNIASIVDETIDFTQSPLVDSDVFLITGNMGSGKTTILDSICLALYNTTPRLNGLSSKISVANNSDKLTLNDPRNMMRRNTGEAFIELLFEGKDGVDYESVWQVQRGKKKNPSSALSNLTWSLKNLATGKITTGTGTKTSEIEKAVSEAVGLDFNQFCRTTMLAQGEFTRFLKSSEDDKADILEKLTKFTDYASVGRTVYAITLEKKNAWEEACRNASDTGLSDVQLAEKNSRVKELEDSRKEQNQKKDNAEAKRNWLKTDADLRTKLTSEEEQHKRALAVLDSDEYKTDISLVNDWNASIEARSWQKNITDAKLEESVQAKSITSLESEFRSVVAGQQYNENNLSELEKRMTALKDYMESKKDKINLFENSQTVLGYLDTIIDARNVISRNELTIKQKSSEKESLEKKLALSTKTLNEEAEKLTMLDAQIGHKETELNDLGIRELRDNHSREKDLLFNIKSALEALSSISIAEEKAVELKPAYEQALVEKRVAQEGKEMLTNTVDKFARQMRQKLSVGCDCPVCRQQVVKLPVENEIDELYSEAEKKLEKAKAEFENIEKQKNKLEAEIKVKKESYSKAVEALKKTQVSADELNAMKAEAENSLAELESKIKAGEAIEKELSSLRPSQTKQNRFVNDARTALETANGNVQKCINEIDQLNGINQSKREDIDTASGKASAIIFDTVMTKRVITDTMQLKQELESDSSIYVQNNTLLTELGVSKKTLEQKVSDVRKVIEDTLTVNPSWKEITTDAAEFMDDLLAAANSVKGKLELANSLLGNARKDIQVNSTLIMTFFTDQEGMNADRLAVLDNFKPADIIAINKRLEQMRSDESTHKGLLEKFRKDIEDHTKNRPELNAEESITSLDDICNSLESTISKIDQEIGGIKVELDVDKKKKEALGALKDIVEKTAEEYSKWKNLNSLIGDKEGKVFKRIAQSFILGGLLDSANSYLQKLEPRYTLIAVPGTLHLSLEDAYQGYSTRGTDSLSGGEGFLVSLALALALADVGQALAVDTLFIDEGFGTLSGQPLVNAINTLRNLHGQNGRHVGIISHIQEVRDNIPVQIQVVQSGKSSSSTINIIG